MAERSTGEAGKLFMHKRKGFEWLSIHREIVLAMVDRFKSQGLTIGGVMDEKIALELGALAIEQEVNLTGNIIEYWRHKNDIKKFTRKKKTAEPDLIITTGGGEPEAEPEAAPGVVNNGLYDYRPVPPLTCPACKKDVAPALGPSYGFGYHCPDCGYIFKESDVKRVPIKYQPLTCPICKKDVVPVAGDPYAFGPDRATHCPACDHVFTFEPAKVLGDFRMEGKMENEVRKTLLAIATGDRFRNLYKLCELHPYVGTHILIEFGMEALKTFTVEAGGEHGITGKNIPDSSGEKKAG